MGIMEIKDPKESANFIANVADHVKINDEGVEKCAQEILKRVNDKRLSLSLKLYKDSGVHPLDIEDKDIEWVFVVSALNFSFWEEPGDKPYLVTYKGKTHHGYMSMCAAINRCLDQGVNLTEPKVYGNITEDQLNCYLMGDNAVPIPMLKERLQCLHDIAQVLNDKYAGKFANCLRECSSAQELLKRTVEEFPCFDDSHFYKLRNWPYISGPKSWWLTFGNYLKVKGCVNSKISIAYPCLQIIEFRKAFYISEPFPTRTN